MFWLNRNILYKKREVITSVYVFQLNTFGFRSIISIPTVYFYIDLLKYLINKENEDMKDGIQPNT